MQHNKVLKNCWFFAKIQTPKSVLEFEAYFLYIPNKKKETHLIELQKSQDDYMLLASLVYIGARYDRYCCVTHLLQLGVKHV